MLYVSQFSGLTPILGYIVGLPCKQGRSTKNSNILGIEQEPCTPKASIENQSLLWQAKATADRPLMLMVGNFVNALAGVHIISAYMGLRPHAMMLLFLVLSVARPPYASFQSRRRERITQLGWILFTGVNKERNAVRRPLYA
jgi:hypothetical protein